MNALPVLGVTGGVASGKSTVTRLFRAYGALCFSADEAARAVLAPHNSLVHKIAQMFGNEVVGPTGMPDRLRLGQIVFADAAARRQLEALLHPPILRLLRAQIESARNDFFRPHIVVVEVPLLYEAGWEEWFDRILLVRVSEATQIRRVMARNGVEEREARRRIAAQWPLEQKAARADFIIDNEGPLENTARRVQELWDLFAASDRAPNQASV